MLKYTFIIKFYSFWIIALLYGTELFVGTELNAAPYLTKPENLCLKYSMLKVSFCLIDLMLLFFFMYFIYFILLHFEIRNVKFHLLFPIVD